MKILFADNLGNIYQEDKPNTYMVYFSNESEYLLNLLLRCGARWVAPCGTSTYVATLNGKEFYFNHDSRPLKAVIHGCQVHINPYTADVQVTFDKFCNLLGLAM